MTMNRSRLLVSGEDLARGQKDHRVSRIQKVRGQTVINSQGEQPGTREQPNISFADCRSSHRLPENTETETDVELRKE